VRKLGYEPAIIAKIEKPEAVENLREIIEAAEGIMVARGDLGVEVPSEQLPVMQKDIISAARERGRIVITATQMLESMIENPRPTRAETSDVANAILDGSDVVMLSGETAVGKHPVATVRAMNDIALHTEKSTIYERAMRELNLDHGGDVADATVHAAATAARELQSKLLVAFTSSGRTCFKISFARPKTHILGCTFTETAYRRLALCWGVRPVLMNEAKSIDELYYKAEKHMLENGLVIPGELSVLITGSNILGGGTNTIKIHRAGVVDVTDDKDVIARFQKLYTKLGI
jgi:pyruvate kinase